MVLTFALRGFSAIKSTPGATECIESTSFNEYYQNSVAPHFICEPTAQKTDLAEANQDFL